MSASILEGEVIAAIEAGDVVLVPNRRAAHALANAYALHAIGQGRSAWPTPQIFTAEIWFQRLWLSVPREISGLSLLSSAQSAVAWDRIVSESPWSDLLLSPSNAARSAFHAWRLMQAWCIPLADFESFDSDETRAFTAWTRAFEQRCAEARWLPAARIPEALLGFPVLPAANVLLLGMERLHPVEERVLERVVRQGGTRRVTHRAASARRLEVFTAATADEELLQAASWARARLEQDATASIAVVVSDLDRDAPRVRRVFEDVFCPGARLFTDASTRPAFTIAAATPLIDYPLVRTALDVLELARGRASSTLAGLLLRSPFLDGAEQEAAARALADARLRRQGREHFDIAALERLADASRCTQLAVHLRATRTLLRDSRGRTTPSRWAERFVALWRSAGWPGDRTLNSDEQQTHAKLNECLAELGGLDDLLGTIDFAQATTELAQIVASTLFEPRTTTAPVTIVDPDSVAGMRFDALWVVGLDAGRWPPPADPDPFIPVQLQVRAGIPEASAAGMRERARERFDMLGAGAGHVVLSWARMDEDVQQDPSPWLSGLPAMQAPIPAERRGHRHAMFAARPMLEAIVDERAPALATRQSPGGSRVVELQSHCPFRAQAELRLQARPLEQVGPGIDPRERGELVHATLSDIWTELRSHAGLMARSPEALQPLVRTTLERHGMRLLEGASAHRARLVGIEIDVAVRRILELLELERQRAPFHVLRQPEVSRRYSIGGLEFTLRLDRIDELEDGGRVVIDYKTGGAVSAAKWWGARPEQPQLPLYAVLEPDDLAAVTFALLSAKHSGFDGVARTDGVLPGVAAYPGRSRRVPPERAEWAQLLPYWSAVIERLVHAFATGDAAVDPLPQACRYCHLSTFCRVNEVGAAIDNGTIDE